MTKKGRCLSHVKWDHSPLKQDHSLNLPECIRAAANIKSLFLYITLFIGQGF